MDSAVIFFFITIYALDCNGMSLREHLNRLWGNDRESRYSDDLRHSHRHRNVRSRMRTTDEFNNLHDSKPRYIIAVLRALDEDQPTRSYTKFNLQNDRRAVGFQYGKQNGKGSEQINILDSPIGQSVKDYYKMELEIAKRKKELQEKKLKNEGVKEDQPLPNINPKLEKERSSYNTASLEFKTQSYNKEADNQKTENLNKNDVNKHIEEQLDKYLNGYVDKYVNSHVIDYLKKYIMNHIHNFKQKNRNSNKNIKKDHTNDHVNNNHMNDYANSDHVSNNENNNDNHHVNNDHTNTNVNNNRDDHVNNNHENAKVDNYVNNIRNDNVNINHTNTNVNNYINNNRDDHINNNNENANIDDYVNNNRNDHTNDTVNDHENKNDGNDHVKNVPNDHVNNDDTDHRVNNDEKDDNDDDKIHEEIDDHINNDEIVDLAKNDEIDDHLILNNVHVNYQDSGTRFHTTEIPQREENDVLPQLQEVNITNLPLPRLLEVYKKLKEEIERRKIIVIDKNGTLPISRVGANQETFNAVDPAASFKTYVANGIMMKFMDPHYPKNLQRTGNNGPYFNQSGELSDISMPYVSDSELATYFRPNGQELTPRERMRNKFYNKANPYLDARKYGSRVEQMLLVYQQRIRPLVKKHRKRRRFMERISRHPKKKIATYAYVDLENIEKMINEFRRQQAAPKSKIIILGNKTLSAEFTSSSEELPLHYRKPPSPVQPDAKNAWFYNMNDAYNHIKINPEAPEFSDLVPEVILEDDDNKWWFYHQADFNPFQD